MESSEFSSCFLSFVTSMRGEEVLMRPRPPSDSTEGTACKPSYELDQYWSRDHLHLWVIGWLVCPLYCDGGGWVWACEPVVIFHIYLGSVSHFCSYTLLIITIMTQLLNTNKLPHLQPSPWPAPFKIIISLWNCSVIDTSGFVVWLVPSVDGEGREEWCHIMSWYPHLQHTKCLLSQTQQHKAVFSSPKQLYHKYNSWRIPLIKQGVSPPMTCSQFKARQCHWKYLSQLTSSAAPALLCSAHLGAGAVIVFDLHTHHHYQFGWYWYLISKVFDLM